MSQNIWNATLEPNNNVKQNTFDWTHVNNLTTQIGRITPIQCELVPAKTSFRVKPFPALQLMPMVFPIQTRMRATISYFRYPLRALWKDFKDFEGNFREGLEEPYHNFNSQSMLDKMLGTGKLMDYLGVPTTFVGEFGNRVNMNPSVCSGSGNTTYFGVHDAFKAFSTIGAFKAAAVGKNVFEYLNKSVCQTSSTTSPGYAIQVLGEDLFATPSTTNQKGVVVFNSAGVSSMAGYSCLLVVDSSNNIVKTVSLLTSDDNSQLQFDSTLVMSNFSNGERFSLYLATIYVSGSLTSINKVKSGYIVVDANVASQDLTLTTSPYYNSNSSNKEKQIKLSSYAARAYEGIYNSFYRDNRNNPYYIDGVVQYNQWIPSYDGGADTYPYELRYANWEKDFLTTAVQSPQQGTAPLVGITTYEQVATVSDEDGNPTQVKQTKVAMVDEEGKRYSLEFESDSDELKSVKYVELDNGTTVRSARSLFDLVTSGISITDLRNVNAYQKFLELNMRKGYSYKEIIEGRFDVKVRYADLLLPEFFGGFSRDINMNAITQTVDKDDANTGSYKDALGSQAGVGYFRGGTDANIECFCDEESIIMGLLVITPLPVYTQLLPKHFLYRGLLDHFNPEFNNISFQPITYKEVCPIQAYNENPDLLTNTFGYQRPWYEYCQRYDQAHGLFRTDLSNFLMHRVFNQKPELAQSFLIVDPDQVTDVFSVTETTDKVYGQILLDCTVKLPVARVAIPRLD